MKKQCLKLLATVLVALVSSISSYGDTGNGVASEIQAYYDGQLFTIQFVEFAPGAEQNLLQHNQSLNFIYQSDPGLPNNQPFISVIDAVPTDGFNPVWEEVQITFNQGFTPHQFYSDDQVLAAAQANEITLTWTGEVYWCPIVGPGPNH